ncbi:hypothetical protein AAGG74_17360 [Bacillus mexicanus]|uniref:hypothetical protein n=1 Tax=Bacillus mexicanus TaxID=2834415 RepID=UPI003D1C7BC7
MKLKLFAITGIAAIALAGCQNVQNGETNHSDAENESNNSVKKDNSSESKSSTNKNQETSQVEKAKDNEVSKKFNSEISTNKQAGSITSSKKQEDKHTEDDQNALKAENIIVTYFNAISAGDLNTLDKIYPSGIEENEQLKKMFETSKITADIVDMKKVSLDQNKAQYNVVVKLFTKKDDQNFTNNKSKYTLMLDVSKGTITNKAIDSTDFLE